MPATLREPPGHVGTQEHQRRRDPRRSRGRPSIDGRQLLPALVPAFAALALIRLVPAGPPAARLGQQRAWHFFQRPTAGRAPSSPGRLDLRSADRDAADGSTGPGRSSCPGSGCRSCRGPIQTSPAPHRWQPPDQGVAGGHPVGAGRRRGRARAQSATSLLFRRRGPRRRSNLWSSPVVLAGRANLAGHRGGEQAAWAAGGVELHPFGLMSSPSRCVPLGGPARWPGRRGSWTCSRRRAGPRRCPGRGRCGVTRRGPVCPPTGATRPRSRPAARDGWGPRFCRAL